MRSTKKGHQGHFGMKLHIGVDSKTSPLHSSTVTASNVHDSQELPKLMHGDETRLCGDSAYTRQKAVMRQRSPKARDFTNQRGFRSRGLTEAQQQTNRRKGSVRSRIEHPFLWIKRIRGFTIAGYRGLAKNASRAFVLLALFNIVQWNRQLTP
jgi:IS5 family transposase